MAMLTAGVVGTGRGEVMNFTHSLQISIYDPVDELITGSVKDLEYTNEQLQYMSFNGLGFLHQQILSRFLYHNRKS